MAVWRVTFTSTIWNAVTMQNVVAFYSKPSLPMTAEVVAAELRDGWCSLWRNGLSWDFVWRNIGVYEVGSNLSSFNMPIFVQGIDGASDASGTAATCAKFRILTHTAGRKGRGRIYITGFRSQYWRAGMLTDPGPLNIGARVSDIKLKYVGENNSNAIIYL